MQNWNFKGIEIDGDQFFLDENGNEIKQSGQCFTGTPIDADVEAARRQSIFEYKFNRILKYVVIEQTN